MEIHENGHRFKINTLYETLLHQPYDYAKEGLLKHLVSNKLINTPNPILNYIFNYVNYSLVYLLKSVDYVKHFKNYNWKNR